MAFALAWTVIALCIAVLWVMIVAWVLSPAPSELDPGDVGFAVLLMVPIVAILVLGLPATSAQAVFGWILVGRSGASTGREPVSVNVGSSIRPLLVPRVHTSASRRVLVVFDLCWTPSWRLAVFALVVAAGVVGLAVFRAFSDVLAGIFLVVVAVVAVVVWRRAKKQLAAMQADLAASEERRKRGEVRAARNLHKRESRRGELARLQSNDRAEFDRLLALEVEREFAKRGRRLKLNRPRRPGQLPVEDIMVSNVIHGMVGTVGNNETRALIRQRALTWADEKAVQK